MAEIEKLINMHEDVAILVEAINKIRWNFCMQVGGCAGDACPMYTGNSFGHRIRSSCAMLQMERMLPDFDFAYRAINDDEEGN